MKQSSNRKYILRIFILLMLISLITLYFIFAHQYRGANIENIFNSSDNFDISKIKKVYKMKDKDFVIMNLADIQLCDTDSPLTRTIILNEIKYLVNEIKPDLITLTGDQTWSNENLLSIKSIIYLLESFKIPYCPIFGNHDYGNSYNSSIATVEYLCDLYESQEYCMFDRGPTNINSLGNYAINIVEDESIIETLYFMDAGYNDYITDGQVEWFKWVSEGIKKANNNIFTKGMLFTHKPLGEFSEAYFKLGNGATSIGEVYYYCSLYGVDESPLGEIAKQHGVDQFVCGHQHTNSMSIIYDGATYTFATKTGELSFYYDDGQTNINGATYFVLDGTNVSINRYFVDSNMFHIKGSDNIAN